LTARARRRWIVLGLAALLVAVALLVLWQVSKARCYTLTGSIVCRVETQEKLVALTFDDGPTARGLERALPLLAQHGAHATFFMIGREAQAAPDLVRRVTAAGHEVANHSYSHERMMGLSSSFYDEEIARTNAVLQQAGAPPPRLFRPPYGAKLWSLPLAVERQGLQMVMIDVEEPLDAPDARTYADRILADVRPGSILLMHLMYSANQLARDALPLVLQGLRERGYRIVSVGELLRHGG
jgi:peptidoglycan/xylan/chitin deacetylase (PgdA/CDA1 family)